MFKWNYRLCLICDCTCLRIGHVRSSHMCWKVLSKVMKLFVLVQAWTSFIWLVGFHVKLSFHQSDIWDFSFCQGQIIWNHWPRLCYRKIMNVDNNQAKQAHTNYHYCFFVHINICHCLSVFIIWVSYIVQYSLWNICDVQLLV